MEKRFLKISSKMLENYPLSGSCERSLGVLLPYGFRDSGSYPSIWFLGGFASNGLDMLNDSGPFRASFAAQLLGYQAEGLISPFFAVFPDCSSSLGGSQFINSAANGPFMDHLCHELLPFFEKSFTQAKNSAASRALTGHSSGGYGSLLTAMEKTGIFGAVIASAADSFFSRTQLPTWMTAAVEINRAGGVDAFLSKFKENAADGKISQSQFVANMQLAMAACYSPSLGTNAAHAALPINLDSLDLEEEVWRKWLDLDPCSMVPQRGAELEKLDHLHLDCGLWDECGAQFGHRKIRDSLVKQGIKHQFDEFSGTHRQTSHRYRLRLAKLSEAVPGYRS